MKNFLGHDLNYFKSKGSELTAVEINHQPRLWKELSIYIEDNKKNIETFMEKALAEKNLRIILTGAGSSGFIGEIVSSVIPYTTELKVEVIHTTDIVSSPKSHLYKDVPTLIISFARSGNSPESIAALEYARKSIDNLYEISICCSEDSKLSVYTRESEKGLLLIMPEGSNDKGFAMTSSVTCMILTAYSVLNYKNIDKIAKEIVFLSDKVNKNTIELIKPIEEFVKNDFDRIIFLGSGGFKGVAHECFVKILELTDGVVDGNFDSSLGFRHGPKTVIKNKTLTVHFISNKRFVAQYDYDLADEVLSERRENQVIVFSNKNEKIIDADMNLFYDGEGFDILEDIACLVQSVVFGQILAMFKSIELGMTPDSPCVLGTVNRVVKGVTIYNLD